MTAVTLRAPDLLFTRFNRFQLGFDRHVTKRNISMLFIDLMSSRRFANYATASKPRKTPEDGLLPRFLKAFEHLGSGRDKVPGEPKFYHHGPHGIGVCAATTRGRDDSA